MPIAVIAHIGSRTWVVGAVGLHAISHAIIAAGCRRHCDRTVIIIAGTGTVITGAVAAL